MKNLKLFEAIAIIISLHGGKLFSKTKLVKILYLIEKAFFEKYHKPLFGLKFKSYFYGPYSKEIDEALEELRNLGFIGIQNEESLLTGRNYYVIQLFAAPNFEALSNEEREFIASLTRNYVEKSLDDILEEVYSTEEYKRTPFGEEIHFGARASFQGSSE